MSGLSVEGASQHYASYVITEKEKELRRRLQFSISQTELFPVLEEIKRQAFLKGVEIGVKIRQGKIT